MKKQIHSIVVSGMLVTTTALSIAPPDLITCLTGIDTKSILCQEAECLDSKMPGSPKMNIPYDLKQVEITSSGSTIVFSEFYDLQLENTTDKFLIFVENYILGKNNPNFYKKSKASTKFFTSQSCNLCYSHQFSKRNDLRYLLNLKRKV